MHSYVAYGLDIRSMLPLPELQTSAEADSSVEAPASDEAQASEQAEKRILIQFGKVEELPAESPPRRGCFHMSPTRAYFFWEHAGTFLVQDGNKITIDVLPGVEEQVVRFCLLGWPLATLLHQRGFLVLHGSAVAVNGKVVSFLGKKGRGKSTMAATLYGRGHILVTDDAVVLDVSGPGSPLVYPGFPQFKLYPEAAASSLGDDPDTLPRLVAKANKRARRATDRFSPTPFPLKRIYILAEGPHPAIKPLQPQEILVHLISNSYVTQFGEQGFQGAQGAAHFRQCTNLANKVSLCRLERHRSLEALPLIAQMVEDDVAQEALEESGNGIVRSETSTIQNNGR